MRKLVMTALDRIELQESQEPDQPRRGEVLVAVSASALGISQLHILAGTTHPAPLPRVLGHEVVGLVRSVGSQVRHVIEGDLVVVNPLAGCGICRQCLANQESICERRTFIGMESDGGWADLLVVPSNQVFRLPRASRVAEAVMLASAVPSAVHAVRRAGVKPGDRVAVLGLGTIGLLLCQVARAFGATTVLGGYRHPRVVTESESFMDLCLATGDDPAPLAARRLLAALDGEGADVVFEAAGTVQMLDVSLGLVRSGGVVLAMGLIEGAQAISFGDYIHEFVMREIEVRTTYAYTKEDFPVSINLYASGRIDVRPLIAGEVEPSDVPALVGELRTSGTSGRRYVIRF